MIAMHLGGADGQQGGDAVVYGLCGRLLIEFTQQHENSSFLKGKAFARIVDEDVLHQLLPVDAGLVCLFD